MAGISVTYCRQDYFLSPILHSTTAQVYPILSYTWSQKSSRKEIYPQSVRNAIPFSYVDFNVEFIYLETDYFADIKEMKPF